ncbi:MAG TPA: PKD domain-containing protein, partial [Acidobacteriota bacterium]|nr:PKD domain-containing protein [Acidobacteriota bacterium]
MLKKLITLMGISVILWWGCSGNDNGGTPVTPAQPTISGFTPASVSRGAQNLNGKITGTNLGSVTHVDLGTGVTVQSATAPNANEVDIVFSVALNASAGAHTITVTTSSGSASSSTLFTVSNNKVPTAAFSVTPTKGAKNTTYVCDATASKDGDGSIATYHWTFGDGKSANGRTVAHQYATAGTFTITLTVTDNDKGQSSVTHSVEVANGLAPVPHFVITPESGDVGTEFTFDGSSSTDDGTIKSFSWKFGDGGTANGAVVRHKYNKSGEMTVVLTVTDDAGLASALDKNLRVENF